ncbi:MAG TPA: hypothetical protein VKE88_03720 [Candidatus Nanoarchaeia archaeon]|nr:hypothetical protein [Candidatus Nanoarchaeia archaeon]
MVDFGTPYYTPMDRAYHPSTPDANQRTEQLETPLFPIHMVGTTVPEIDQTGRNKNIIEGVDASFRGGAGNIQLVMQVVGQTSGMGGGPKAYGEEVRQAIREVQRASNSRITGVELPTQINNVSGFTQNGFSEEQRRVALEEIKDSIKFVGDIAGGGSVDVVSWEFARSVSDAPWKGKESTQFQQKGEEYAMLVDKETGKIVPIDKKDKFYLYYDPKTLKEDERTPHEFNWQKLVELAKENGKRPEEFWVQDHFNKQLRSLKGQEGQYEQYQAEAQQSIELTKERLNSEEMKNLKTADPNQYAHLKSVWENQISSAEKRMEGFDETLKTLKVQEKELEHSKEKFMPVKDFALAKSADSYATAGIWAMQETQKNQYVKKENGIINVGPEMGWPQYYGSHPDEWIELIRKSREEMVRKLTQKELQDPISGQKQANPYYQGVSEEKAKELAKNHIKGEVDTSHMGMWLQTFRQDLPWDQRVSEFKTWYKNQIEHIAEVNKKEDIIGGIQVVDSASGAHGHLPAGEGILGKDIFEYMKILKEKGGYKGELTAEGHEEEKFNQGRILTKTWETFGSPIGSSYWQNKPSPQFKDIRQSYAATSYGSTGIFQSYVPSNDFTLWSNVPLE